MSTLIFWIVRHIAWSQLYGMAPRDKTIAAAIAEAARPFGVPILGMAFTAHKPRTGTVAWR